MSERVCGQTLVLIDNDGTVSGVNQKIIKSTLKYMLYHTPSNRAYCISTYSHDLEDEEVYTTDINELLCKVDLLEFAPKDSNLTDVVSTVLTNWKESDFACRDILIFTDGLEGKEMNYEKEELYYLIDNTSYPIYIVDLVQDNNTEAKKQLSAIATTSEGKLFLSEFEGDDAEVDKQLSNAIFNKMDEYAKKEWAIYENDGEDKELAEEENRENELLPDDTDDGLTDEYSEIAEDISEEVVYDLESNDSNNKPEIIVGAFIALLIVITGTLVCGLIYMKRRHKSVKNEDEIKKFITKSSDFGVDTFDDEPFDFVRDNEFIGFENDGETTLLRSEGIEEGTRLLVSSYTHEIELRDTNNSANTKLIAINDKVVVGRKEDMCDYVIRDDSISKRHCELRYEKGDFFITDLSSSNGTYINGERIVKSKITTGDKLKLGQREYILKCT